MGPFCITRRDPRSAPGKPKRRGDLQPAAGRHIAIFSAWCSTKVGKHGEGDMGNIGTLGKWVEPEKKVVPSGYVKIAIENHHL